MVLSVRGNKMKELKVIITKGIQGSGCICKK